MQNLQVSKKLALTLEDDDISIVKWWVDASFMVHKDMHSHTGGTMSLCKGAIYFTSTCQKFSTKSFTEAKLVAVDNVMLMILWTWQFLEHQGYPVKENVVYQDNQSAIWLEKNGQQYCSKGTRHLNIQYYFITD